MPDGGYSDGMTVLGRIWPLWMTGVATGAVFGLWMVVTQITFLPVGVPLVRSSIGRRGRRGAKIRYIVGGVLVLVIVDRRCGCS